MWNDNAKVVIAKWPIHISRSLDRRFRSLRRRKDHRAQGGVCTLPASGAERLGDDAAPSARRGGRPSTITFLSQEDFARRARRGEFLECFEVFGRGYWYGTLESEVAPRLAAGKWVVLEIDVDGTLAVLRAVFRTRSRSLCGRNRSTSWSGVCACGAPKARRPSSAGWKWRAASCICRPLSLRGHQPSRRGRGRRDFADSQRLEECVHDR